MKWKRDGVIKTKKESVKGKGKTKSKFILIAIVLYPSCTKFLTVEKSFIYK